MEKIYRVQMNSYGAPDFSTAVEVKPLYTSPKTLRDYDQYKSEVAYAHGWNDAVEFIFGAEELCERDFKVVNGGKNEQVQSRR